MSNWLQVHPARAGAEVRLVAFHHAGGNAGFFRPWAARLAPHVELAVVELPGRRVRLAEPPLRSIDAILDGLAPAVVPLLERRCVFFGHSMGALVAFELARHLRDRGLPLPSALIVSGRRAPQLPRTKPDLHRLPDVELVAELAALGGTSADILREPELMEMLLPPLRADLTALETWHHAASTPLELPITALGGASDEQASRADLEAWSTQTVREFEVRQFPGGHFYLVEQEAALLDWLRPALDPARDE